MFDELFECSQNFSHFRELLYEIQRFFLYFENEFELKDPNLKNEALDAIKLIIETQKDKKK